jgi:hypothetical protein
MVVVRGEENEENALTQPFRPSAGKIRNSPTHFNRPYKAARLAR